MNVRTLHDLHLKQLTCFFSQTTYVRDSLGFITYTSVKEFSELVLARNMEPLNALYLGTFPFMESEIVFSKAVTATRLQKIVHLLVHNFHIPNLDIILCNLIVVALVIEQVEHIVPDHLDYATVRASSLDRVGPARAR